MSSLDEYYKGGPKTVAEAFPPICLRSHWDPTVMTHYILPSMPLETRLAMDPRPSTKICTTYYNTSMGDAPLPNPSAETPLEIPLSLRGGPHRPIPPPASPASSAAVYPPGGAAGLGFPYKAYNPDQESEVLLVNRGLTKCAESRYVPKNFPPANHAVEGVSQAFVTRVLEVNQEAGCRGADDAAAWSRSSRMFMNPTRYDRTSNLKKTS
jgi:hypothetical protein